MPKSRKYEGVVFRRKESNIWWIRYRDRNGNRRRESTLREDWNEAQKRLRERLDARDNNVLDVVRKGESLSLNQWADFFLENYSKPPLRMEKTHEVNLRAAKHLKSAFGLSKLVDITADSTLHVLSCRSFILSPQSVRTYSTFSRILPLAWSCWRASLQSLRRTKLVHNSRRVHMQYVNRIVHFADVGLGDFAAKFTEDGA